MDASPPGATELRRFGFILAGMIAGVFGLLLPWLWGFPLPVWPWVVAAMLALPALVAPALLRPVHRAWVALAAVLAWVNTRVLLAVVFYLMIVPVGLAMRLVGHDPLRRKTTGAASLRVPSAERAPRDMEKPY